MTRRKKIDYSKFSPEENNKMVQAEINEDQLDVNPNQWEKTEEERLKLKKAKKEFKAEL